LRTQSRIANFGSVVLSKRDKELLVACEALLFRPLLAAERCAVAVVSGGDASNVSNILRQRLLAVQ
jgi:hypothetical protein